MIWSWRTLALVSTTVLVAAAVSFVLLQDLRDFTRPFVSQLFSGNHDDPRTSFRSGDDVGKSETVGLFSNTNVIATTAVQASNFQEVGRLSQDASLWRLSRGVGRLVITDPIEKRTSTSAPAL